MQDFLNQRWGRFASCFHWGTFGILNHPVLDAFVDKCFSLLGLTTATEKILSRHESGLVLNESCGAGNPNLSWLLCSLFMSYPFI